MIQVREISSNLAIIQRLVIESPVAASAPKLCTEGCKMNENAMNYYRQREEQERDLADRTSQPQVRKIHLDLADRYAEMTGSAVKSRPTLGIIAAS